MGGKFLCPVCMVHSLQLPLFERPISYPALRSMKMRRDIWCRDAAGGTAPMGEG